MVLKLLFVFSVFHLSSAVEFMTLDADADTSGIHACHPDHVVSCVKVDIDFDVLRSSDTLTFPGGVEMTVKSELHSRPGFVSHYYEGSTPLETATLTYPEEFDDGANRMRRPGDHVAGTAHYNDNVYVIEYCGPDCHVWYEEDKDKFIGDMNTNETLNVPEDFDRSDEQLQRSLDLIRMGLEDRQSIVEVSMIVYYTTDVKNEFSDIAGIVDNMIANSNVGFQNSNVPLRVRLFCLEELVGFVENRITPPTRTRILQDFTNFRGNLDNLRKSADIAMLLAKDSGNPNIAGEAWIGTRFSLSPAGYTIAQYAQTSLTPVHEIAHMFGALHNRENSNTNNPPYPYGYGKWFLRGNQDFTGYRTIMAYWNRRYHNRVNYFSSPSVTFNGVTTGDSNTDNVRVLTDNRFRMANEGDESQTCGGGGVGPLCADEDSNCPNWISYCGEHSYVNANCDRTCGLCGDCQDFDSRCPNWTVYCDGVQFPIVPGLCRASCGLCGTPCQDEDSRCPSWTTYCGNHAYVNTNCHRTCGTC